jgi:hypothetical protein
MTPERSLPRRDRIRRVVILCCAFARNLTYYRAGSAGEATQLLSTGHPEASFWRQVNSNFLDIAVLDWCKLFGDQKKTHTSRIGKHHWRRVVTDPEAFESRLLAKLDIDAEAFAALISKMRDYRDQFVAHLDDGLVMNIPELATASAAVTFYHRHVVEVEAQPGDLERLPDVDKFSRGWGDCIREAERIYRVNL